MRWRICDEPPAYFLAKPVFLERHARNVGVHALIEEPNGQRLAQIMGALPALGSVLFQSPLDDLPQFRIAGAESAAAARAR